MAEIHTRGPRMAWVDAAKAWGIFLIFYGHFVERVSQSGNSAAFPQYKLVYSFHVILFIVLSGYVARVWEAQPRLAAFLRRQTASRLLPVLFFSVAMMPLLWLEYALVDYLPVGNTQIRAKWIGSEMCRRLGPPEDAEHSRARYKLWMSLPADVQHIVSECAASDTVRREAGVAIAEALNRSLDSAVLFAPSDFGVGEISSRTKDWLASDRSSQPLERIRRRNADLMWGALFPEWGGEESFLEDWTDRAKRTVLRGSPNFAVPTWFLVCLFVLEAYHFVVSRLLTSAGRIALAVVAFYVAGWLLNRNVDKPFTDVWFLRESVFLYAFYLLGFLLRSTEALERLRGTAINLAIMVAGGAMAWLTFDLNSGSRFFAPVVYINLSQHGDLLYFTVTALAGSLAVVGLARLTAGTRLIALTGRHTLILMGLNSFFFSFANHALVGVLGLPSTPSVVAAGCLAVTLASLATCVPGAWLLNRYLPQLVGRPRQAGPLLPPLA